MGSKSTHHIMKSLQQFQKESTRQKSKKENPLDILKKRFAQGEISKEEFEESKKVLKSEI